MEQILLYVKQEWATVSEAPFTFLLLLVMAFAAAFVVVRWGYQRVLALKDEQKSTLMERLQHKSELLESYKERALKYDEKVKDVVESDSADLKDKTLSLVSDIREFIERSKRQDELIQQNEWAEMARAEDEQSKARLWKIHSNAILRASSERNAEWDRRFKVNAMLLRDELLSRLKDYQSEPSRDDRYEYPTNYFGFEDVASDLEKMAKSL